MKISAVKKELSDLLETPIKSAKDLTVAATTNTKLAEVMEAWSFLNYTKEYSWNTLLSKLVPDNSLITQAKEYLITNWDVKETNLVIGHTYIEIKYGYEVTGVIHLTTDNTLTCASFTGIALFEDLMMLVEIVGQGVNENLSSECGGVTGNEVNLAGVSYLVGTMFRGVLSQSFTDIKEAYQDFNSFTANELVDEDSVILIEVIDNSEVVIDSKSKEEIQQSTSAIVATETSDNVTEFKGIPVEHFNHASNAWLSAMGNNLDNSVLISTDTYEGTPLVNINNGGEIVFTSSFLESLKLANHYLATEDEQIKQAIASNIPHQYAAVLGGQQQNQVTSSEPLPGSVVLSPKHYLKPKIYLFAAMTEFVFLMECYLDLIGYFFNLSSSLSEISSQLYFSWCSLTAICFKRYVLMPTIGSDNHTKLLMIWHEATYNSLERKSIYV